MRVTKFILSILLVTMSPTLQINAKEAINNYCQVTPVRSNAVDWPSKHAWDLFVSLNHPAVDENLERGQPDCTKPVGEPGTTVVWETWRNADSEVYLSDGSEPPDWNDTSLPDEQPGRVPDVELMTVDGKLTPSYSVHSEFHPFFSPKDGVFKGQGGFGETRINRSTYEFIKRECLFSVKGTQAYARAIINDKKPQISFPSDSIEVKAAWLDFEERNIPEEKRKTYYTAEYKGQEEEYQGKSFGLVALHIITKDIPNWFWASFHHIDAPENKFETPDTYGRPKVLDGTVWENYTLGGNQIDFVSPTGQATILSDHFVEFGFQRSSCITCHATATISTDGFGIPGAQPIASCSMTPEPIKDCRKFLGDAAFKPGTDELILERGVPNPEWFKKDGKPFYFQTDFVYSIPFRTSRNDNGTASLPKRCKW